MFEGKRRNHVTVFTNPKQRKTGLDWWHIKRACLPLWPHIPTPVGCVWRKSFTWHFWRPTCRWCRTYQSAGGCSFPAAFAAPRSGQQVGYPESADAYNPERLRRGSYTPGSCPEQGNLRRETHGSRSVALLQLCSCFNAVFLVGSSINVGLNSFKLVLFKVCHHNLC